MAGAGDQAGAAKPVEVLVDEELDDRAGRVIAGGSESGMSIAGIAVASFMSPHDVPSWAVSQRPGASIVSTASCRILVEGVS